MGTQHEIEDFASLVGRIGQGECGDEAFNWLRRVVSQCAEEALAQNAKTKGSVTLTFEVVAEPTGAVFLGYDLKRKEPKPARRGAMVFVSDGGQMLLQDPRQTTFGDVVDAPPRGNKPVN